MDFINLYHAYPAHRECQSTCLDFVCTSASPRWRGHSSFWRTKIWANFNTSISACIPGIWDPIHARIPTFPKNEPVTGDFQKGLRRSKKRYSVSSLFGQFDLAKQRIETKGSPKRSDQDELSEEDVIYGLSLHHLISDFRVMLSSNDCHANRMKLTSSQDPQEGQDDLRLRSIFEKVAFEASKVTSSRCSQVSATIHR